MAKLKDLNLKGKKVLIRADLNVSFRNAKDIEKEDKLIDSLDTIKYVIKQGGIPIIMSHLGRPGGKVDSEHDMKPVAKALSSKLGTKVTLTKDCIGNEAENLLENAQPGDAFLLQNLRFHPGEKANDAEFVKKLAKLGDVYINDAFGTVHREQGSVYGVPSLFKKQKKPVAVGLLIQKEIKTWTEAIEGKGPKYLCLGGKKLKEKIGALEKLSGEFEKIYVGGPIYNVIRAAQDRSVGSSLIKEENDDTDYVAKTKRLLQTIDNLVLPDKLVIARMKEKKEGNKKVKVYVDEKTIAETDEVPDEYMIVDCIYDKEKLASFDQANFGIAFGPMGIFEDSRFAKGSSNMAKALDRAKKTILGGGESGQAYRLAKKAYISTGGGASVEFYIQKIQGKQLKVIEILN